MRVRFVRAVWEACKIFGALAMAGYGIVGSTEEDRRTVGFGGGPAPGHPERLSPDVPLSGVELALARELEARCEWPPGRGDAC